MKSIVINSKNVWKQFFSSFALKFYAGAVIKKKTAETAIMNIVKFHNCIDFVYNQIKIYYHKTIQEEIKDKKLMNKK